MNDFKKGDIVRCICGSNFPRVNNCIGIVITQKDNELDYSVNFGAFTENIFKNFLVNSSCELF